MDQLSRSERDHHGRAGRARFQRGCKAIEPGLSDIQKKIFTYINDVITPNCSPANPPAGAGSSEVTSLITDLEEKVYYGEITAEAAAQELFEEGNRIMSEAAAQ